MRAPALIMAALVVPSAAASKCGGACHLVTREAGLYCSPGCASMPKCCDFLLNGNKAFKLQLQDANTRLRRVSMWVNLLKGKAETSRQYWVNSTVPQRRSKLIKKRSADETRSLPSWKQRFIHTSRETDGILGPLYSMASCDLAKLPGPDTDTTPWCAHDEIPLIRAGRSCAVTTIGVGGEWDFEDWAASKFGCNIHAFDPTNELRERHQQHASKHISKGGISFHFIGLSNGSNAVDKRLGSVYGTIRSDTSTMLTLGQIIERHPVPSGYDHILKIDCEGCEWSAFEQVSKDNAAQALLRKVRIIFMEIHVAAELVPPTPSQLDAYFTVLTGAGFKLWNVEERRGAAQYYRVDPYLAYSGIEHGVCCFTLAWLRED